MGFWDGVKTVMNTMEVAYDKQLKKLSSEDIKKALSKPDIYYRTKEKLEEELRRRGEL